MQIAKKAFIVSLNFTILSYNVNKPQEGYFKTIQLNYF